MLCLILIKRVKMLQVNAGMFLLFGCTGSDHKKQNRLINASSPYLKEHADNPVDWYEWGSEALDKAKKENKPLLISIGYSSCHWCHVMERESFMDTTVARLMNESFVCIKVDREERPDLDNIYLHACQLMNNGEAGWPLNAFALPDGKPFFAGTYYSKENWIKLLKQIADSYKNKYSKVVLQANSLTYGIIDNDSLLLQEVKGKSEVSKELYRSFFESAYWQIDSANGGLKVRQKFPTPSLWEFLLQYNYHSKDQRALDITVNTLTKMAFGGIYDHVGGGFARYATDSAWRVPHFEKMLYDNAQLVSLYAHAYQVTQNDYFKRVALETIDFIERDLAASEGGFYSSLSADTDKGEGEFYTWQPGEIDKTIGKSNSGLIKAYYNITAEGNWKGKGSILYVEMIPSAFSLAKKIPEQQFIELLDESKAKMLAERNKRLKPAVDDKILTSWNALLLKGYADAYTALGNETYLKKALTLAAFLEKNMLQSNGQLWRNFTRGKTSIDAFLDDYAFLAKAFIRLYEVTFDKHWLLLADKITAYAIANFYDSKTGFFYYSPAASKELIVRKTEVLNNVIPSSNAVMGEVLFALGTLFQKDDYLQMCSAMMSKMAGKIGALITGSPEWGYLTGLVSHTNYEVVIMGKDALQKNVGLQENYLPSCLFMGGMEENLPLLENKLSGDNTLIYVCSDKVCKLPAKDVTKALQQIK
jgi:uncharacterized protein